MNPITDKPISSASYHADTTRISKSGLDKIRKSPAHYYAAYLDPNRKPETTADLTVGDVFHTAVLEPHKFFERYILPSQKIDRRYRDGKQAFQAISEAAKGRQFINLDVYERAMRMRDSVFANPIAKRLFDNGIAERTCFFTDDETGAPCKCRPDWETPDTLLVDLKSAKDASEYGFAKSVRDYSYWVQAPFYQDGILAERGVYPEAMIFVACEKKPPYNVGLYTLSEQDLAIGRETYKQDLLTWMECRKTGIWPGYNPKVVTLKIFK